MKTIRLEFQGYMLETAAMPDRSGIYCVYSCVLHESKKSILINKLLYIGKSKDINERLSDHEHYKDWKKELAGNEVLCYSFAPIQEADKGRAEAALIYQHKPPVNNQNKYSFNGPDTHMILKGAIKNLNSDFTVYPT